MTVLSFALWGSLPEKRILGNIPDMDGSWVKVLNVQNLVLKGLLLALKKHYYVGEGWVESPTLDFFFSKIILLFRFYLASRRTSLGSMVVMSLYAQSHIEWEVEKTSSVLSSICLPSHLLALISPSFILVVGYYLGE